ncbi:MAG: Fic family protein [Candidatus Nitrosotenuis sp.]
MVSLKKKVKNGKAYYYLKHHNGLLSKEIYLGTTQPSNLTQLKREFLLQFQRDLWKPQLDAIKKGYDEYLKKTPKSLLEQNLVEFSYYFTHDTQKIEGSSLTQQETYNLLRFHITPTKKPESDMIEAQRHHSVFLKAMRVKNDLTLKMVLQWHKEIFEKTKPEFAGKIRHFPVYIVNSQTTFPHAKFVLPFLKDFFKWYDKNKTKINPVELAGLAHFRFVNIHPFGDGNGRISRLIMNKILYKNGYPLLNIRFIERKRYFKAIENGNLNEDENYFLKWFMKKYHSENKRFIH